MLCPNMRFIFALMFVTLAGSYVKAEGVAGNIQRHKEGNNSTITWFTVTSYFGSDVYIEKGGKRLVHFKFENFQSFHERAMPVGNGKDSFGLRLNEIKTEDAGKYVLKIDNTVFGQNILFVYGKLRYYHKIFFLEFASFLHGHKTEGVSTIE